MTSQDRVRNVATTSDDYADSYYTDAHLGGAGAYDWESWHWRTFFTGVADRIVGLVEPRTVLDVGCAKGLLVQALAARGVDASGTDISETAIATAHPDVRDRLRVASATDPIEGRYDLVTCIEVLEHMAPEDAQRAIDAMCGATDRILFSSTPSDFDESTHVNIHPTAQWAAWFAERGFYRRTDADVAFLTRWAVLFERADLSRRSIVERYESRLTPLTEEVAEKREALLEANRRLAAQGADRRVVELSDDSIQARHAELVARDHVIGLEAKVANLELDLRQSRMRVERLRRRLEDRDAEVVAIRDSRTWKVGRLVTGPLGRLRR